MIGDDHLRKQLCVLDSKDGGRRSSEDCGSNLILPPDSPVMETAPQLRNQDCCDLTAPATSLLEAIRTRALSNEKSAASITFNIQLNLIQRLESTTSYSRPPQEEAEE
ncbi:hypothetical protein NDU88_007551 [Pleurodeles waltl]|uniref:Uncharacterized protein n=1 Tax=Pleurodeles waltl TaxID=8319 RepID=A0AAV7NWL1_PLEWA|nr:hypothetical protein NDU88_007551 [Pleurodeles waltl]